MSILQRYLEQQRQNGGVAHLPPDTFELENEHGDWLWNVSLARQHAPAYHQPCLLQLTPLFGHVYDPEHDPEPDEPRYPVNRYHALTNNNLQPLILIQVARPLNHSEILFETVIDGWHRIYRAQEEKKTELPCWIIPARREPDYRLFHQPPGARP